MTKIYIASKTIHAPTWRALRRCGAPINSSWIDQAGDGETDNMTKLWRQIEDEIEQCDHLVFFANALDTDWKGAFVEVGMAIGMEKLVIVCLPDIVLCKKYRPIGSWVNHPNVIRNDDFYTALCVPTNLKVGGSG